MSVWKLILQEILFRKTHFALSAFAVALAATLFVAGPTLVRGYGRETRQTIDAQRQELHTELAYMENETRKNMLKLGFNLIILHRDTNMVDFRESDYSAEDMPQEYVNRLANAKELTLVTHLVATLQQKVKWNQRRVLLVGYLPEVSQPHRGKKKPMCYSIAPGEVFLGYELGVGHAEGEEIDVLGKTFRIARILPEKGDKKDITIAMDLADAQKVLGKKDKVNQILALGCKCAGERLPKIRKQLETVLPETKISEFESRAVARAEQRDLIAEEKEKLIASNEKSRQEVETFMGTLDAIMTPIVVLACVLWVGLMSLSNVRERRTEIGLLRALGLGSRKIATLFLGKAALIGIAGGLTGFGLGTLLALQLGVRALEVDNEHFAPEPGLLLWAAIGAPILCAAASYLPTLTAITQDPAEVLREE